MRSTTPRRVLALWVGPLFLALLWAADLSAQDPDITDGILVDTTIDAVDINPGDGQCVTAADACSLRAAIQEANATAGPDEINLPAGTYALTLVGDREDAAATGDLDITDTLTLTGAGSSLSTIEGLPGPTDIDRVFHVLDPTETGVAVVISDLSVTGGAVLNESGGGLLLEAPESDGGPPLRVEEGGLSVTVIRTSFQGNVASSNTLDPEDKPVGGSGGGVFSEGDLTVQESVVSANEADANGGGIYSGGPFTVTDTEVSDNSAEGGGGIFLTGASPAYLERCLISGNEAVGGGGLTSRAQVFVFMTNCTVDGNSATDVGAGIQAGGGYFLTNCTVTDNRSDTEAPFGGAGLNTFGGGDFRMRNNLIAENFVASQTPQPELRNCGCTGGLGCTPGAQYLSLDNNLEDADTCLLSEPADLVSTEPSIGPLADNGGLTRTRALLLGSAAIDAGAAAPICPAVDQRGIERPLDGDADGDRACDIGAFEFPELIFADDFESGDTSAWSETVSPI